MGTQDWIWQPFLGREGGGGQNLEQSQIRQINNMYRMVLSG